MSTIQHKPLQKKMKKLLLVTCLIIAHAVRVTDGKDKTKSYI